MFYQTADRSVYHTYSSYARGGEEILGAYAWLDLTPKGRNENGPSFTMRDWVFPHDRYDASGYVDPTGGYHEARAEHE